MRDLGEKRRQYWFVIQQLTARELKRKYARSALGIVWSVLNPLLSMGVLSLIFLPDVPPVHPELSHLLSHRVPVVAGLYGGTNAAMTTLADNRALLLKVKFPMELFILTRGYTALINLGYSLVAYGVMLAVFRIPVSWPALFLVPIVGCLFLFSLGISYVLSAAYVFFAGEETQEGIIIFVLFLHRRRLVYRLGFHHLYAAADQGIFHFDFNALAVHTDIDMVLLRMQKDEANSAFNKFVRKNYESWVTRCCSGVSEVDL